MEICRILVVARSFKGPTTFPGDPDPYLDQNRQILLKCLVSIRTKLDQNAKLTIRTEVPENVTV